MTKKSVEAMLIGRWSDSSEPIYQKAEMRHRENVFRYITIDNTHVDLLAKIENNGEKLVDISSSEGTADSLMVFTKDYFDSLTALIAEEKLYVNPDYFSQKAYREMLPEIAKIGYEKLKGTYKPEVIIATKFEIQYFGFQREDLAEFFKNF